MTRVHKKLYDEIIISQRNRVLFQTKWNVTTFIWGCQSMFSYYPADDGIWWEPKSEKKIPFDVLFSK